MSLEFHWQLSNWVGLLWRVNLISQLYIKIMAHQIPGVISGKTIINFLVEKAINRLSTLINNGWNTVSWINVLFTLLIRLLFKMVDGQKMHLITQWAYSFGQCESQWGSSNAEISAIRSINLCFHIPILLKII